MSTQFNLFSKNYYAAQRNIAGSIASVGSNVSEGLSEVASAQKETAWAIRWAGNQIADSNIEIANAIINSFESMRYALDRLTDEFERKRKTDEYYSLLEKIDSLEDKIITTGASLKEVYEKIDFTRIKGPINLSYSEIVFLLENVSEKNLEFLKVTSRHNKVHPFEIIYQVIADESASYEMTAEYKTKYNGDQVDGRLIVKRLDGFSFTLATYFADCSKIDPVGKLYLQIPDGESHLGQFIGKILRKQPGEFIFEFQEKEYPVEVTIEDPPESKLSIREFIEQATYVYGSLRKFGYDESLFKLNIDDLETKLELIRIVLAEYNSREGNFEETPKWIKKFESIKEEFAVINCEIILENLRILFEKLTNAYRDIKIGKA